MPAQKKEHPEEKTNLHPRSKHRGRYDFGQLIASSPELARFVSRNAYGDESVDFFNPDAVRALNTALLKHYYGIAYWEIPANYLCPPIPGRADYIHHIADLLYSKCKGALPPGEKIHCLDIGTGANGVYPIIGTASYGWKFVGTDVDPVALASAQRIVDRNPSLKGKIELRLQEDPRDILQGILKKNERFDLVICNPPFHSSAEEAQAGTLRKLNNLKRKKVTNPVLNFGGQSNELWCEGGEVRFILDMIRESWEYSDDFFWFSAVVSKQSSLDPIYRELEEAEAEEVKTIPMGQGNKMSRVVAWTFLTPEQQQAWMAERWK